MSPPIDERSGFMPMHQHHQRQGSGLGIGSGIATPPGTPYVGANGSEYAGGGTHEMDDAHTSTGLRYDYTSPLLADSRFGGADEDSPYQAAHVRPAEPVDEGPHEMGVPSRQASAAQPMSARPFSYTDSEIEFSAESRSGAESRNGVESRNGAESVEHGGRSGEGEEW